MRAFVLFAGIGLLVSQAFADVSLETSLSAEKLIDKSAVLQGKRLFFEAMKRESNDTKNAAEDSSYVEDRSNRTRQKGSADNTDVKVNASSGSHQYQPKSVSLRYDARVHHEDALRIIINGLPCRPLLLSSNASESIEQALQCPSIPETGLQLFLMQDKRRVRVVRHTLAIGVLSPGQSL